MSLSQKTYQYRIMYFKRGQWVPVLQTDFEEKDTFEMIANMKEYQYRILRDGVDVTVEYKTIQNIELGGCHGQNS